MSRPAKGSMPRPDPETKEAFEGLVADLPGVAVRPMFGNVSAFVNGNMFAGLFGNDLFVRLPEDGRGELIEAGGAEFSPMPGRAMKEYVALPRTWLGDSQLAQGWIDRSLAWAGQLPPKEPRRKRTS